MQAPLLIEQLYLPDKPVREHRNIGDAYRPTGCFPTFVEAVRTVVGETDTLRIRLRMEDDSVYPGNR